MELSSQALLSPIICLCVSSLALLRSQKDSTVVAYLLSSSLLISRILLGGFGDCWGLKCLSLWQCFFVKRLRYMLLFFWFGSSHTAAFWHSSVSWKQCLCFIHMHSLEAIACPAQWVWSTPGGKFSWQSSSQCRLPCHERLHHQKPKDTKVPTFLVLRHRHICMML